jgi:Flp pilus assembly pilin Flp
MTEVQAAYGSAICASTSRSQGRRAGRWPQVSSAARALLCDESAQGLVEYALLITFTALVCIVALRFLGGKTNNTLSNAGNNLS